MSDRFDFADHIAQFDREFAALRAGIVPASTADAIAAEAATLERDRADAADRQRVRLAREQARIPIAVVRVDRERARADAEQSARRRRAIRERGLTNRARGIELEGRGRC